MKKNQENLTGQELTLLLNQIPFVVLMIMAQNKKQTQDLADNLRAILRAGTNNYETGKNLLILLLEIALRADLRTGKHEILFEAFSMVKRHIKNNCRNLKEWKEAADIIAICRQRFHTKAAIEAINTLENTCQLFVEAGFFQNTLARMESAIGSHTEGYIKAINSDKTIFKKPATAKDTTDADVLMLLQNQIPFAVLLAMQEKLGSQPVMAKERQQTMQTLFLHHLPAGNDNSPKGRNLMLMLLELSVNKYNLGYNQELFDVYNKIKRCLRQRSYNRKAWETAEKAVDACSTKYNYSSDENDNAAIFALMAMSRIAYLYADAGLSRNLNTTVQHITSFCVKAQAFINQTNLQNEAKTTTAFEAAHFRIYMDVCGVFGRG